MQLAEFLIFINWIMTKVKNLCGQSGRFQWQDFFTISVADFRNLQSTGFTRTRYSVKPWISTISQAKKYSWEIYRDPQECASYVTTHYPFVIEPLSHFGQQSLQAILSAISQKLEFTSERTIHQATEERVVISFSWYKDAIQAFRLLNRTSSLYINGVPYRFNMDTSKEYLPRVVADHYDYRLLVALKSLPCVCVHLQLFQPFRSIWRCLNYVSFGNNI